MGTQMPMLDHCVEPFSNEIEHDNKVGKHQCAVRALMRPRAPTGNFLRGDCKGPSRGGISL